jgi:hypothetical protein
LTKAKKKGKRHTDTDNKVNGFNNTFTDFIKLFNRNKPKDLKEIIRNYFK